MFKKYGLSITLFILFIASWFGQAYFQWIEFKEEQLEHQQEAIISDFIAPFGAATFENWQSEFLQLFSFVILSTYLIHKNSPQSKDGDELMQQKLDRIERLLRKK